MNFLLNCLQTQWGREKGEFFMGNPGRATAAVLKL